MTTSLLVSASAVFLLLQLSRAAPALLTGDVRIVNTIGEFMLLDQDQAMHNHDLDCPKSILIKNVVTESAVSPYRLYPNDIFVDQQTVCSSNTDFFTINIDEETKLGNIPNRAIYTSESTRGVDFLLRFFSDDCRWRKTYTDLCDSSAVQFPRLVKGLNSITCGGYQATNILGTFSEYGAGWGRKKGYTYLALLMRPALENGCVYSKENAYTSTGATGPEPSATPNPTSGTASPNRASFPSPDTANVSPDSDEEALEPSENPIRGSRQNRPTLLFPNSTGTPPQSPAGNLQSDNGDMQAFETITPIVSDDSDSRDSVSSSDVDFVAATNNIPLVSSQAFPPLAFSNESALDPTQTDIVLKPYETISPINSGPGNSISPGQSSSALSNSAPSEDERGSDNGGTELLPSIELSPDSTSESDGTLDTLDAVDSKGAIDENAQDGEDESADSPSACFPGSAYAQLESGLVKSMGELNIGDRVLTGSGHYSAVFMFTHRLKAGMYRFISIQTPSSSSSLLISADHLLAVGGRFKPAESIVVGDLLELGGGSFDTVNSTQVVRSRGLYHPQTDDGSIVVNGFVASTYTSSISPAAAHALLWPFRQIFKAIGSRIDPSFGALEAGSDKLVALASLLNVA